MRSIILSLFIIITNATFVPIVSTTTTDDVQEYSSDDRGHHVQGDELILTGGEGGCWDDDECQAYPPETGSGHSDDLITPRIVVLNPRPSLAPAQGMRTSSIGSSCLDDEDCNLYEGSGYDSSSSSRTVPGQRPRYPYDPDDTNTPSNVRPYSPPPSTAWEDDKSILYTSKPIPPSDPVTQYPIIPKPRPTAPRPTGPRVIVDVPKPVIPSRETSSGSSPGGPGSGSSSKKERGSGHSKSRTPSVTTTNTSSVYNKSAADRTALVIGLVAAILIIIVVVAPLIVFCKVKLRGAVGKGGQLLTTSSGGDRNPLYQPFVQPTVTVSASGHPLTPGQQPRLFPASITSASLGHGLLSTSGHYGQIGGGTYGTVGRGGGQGGVYGTIGGGQSSAPGTLPKKKDNREWYV